MMDYDRNPTSQPGTAGTVAAEREPSLRLGFTVSLNEEHVSVHVASRLAVVTLGERAHHYSLLELARLRLRDAERGLDHSSQGWIETGMLAHSLGLDITHLNIHIFRIRSQLRQAAARLGMTVELVERRRCELRFGDYSFTILRGSRLESTFPNSTWDPHRMASPGISNQPGWSV